MQGNEADMQVRTRQTRGDEIVVAGKCVDCYTLRDYEKVYSVRRGSVLQKQAELACTEYSKQ